MKAIVKYRKRLLELLLRSLYCLLIGYIFLLPFSKLNYYCWSRSFVIISFMKWLIGGVCSVLFILGFMGRRITLYISVLLGCFLIGQYWLSSQQFVDFSWQTSCKIFFKWIFGFLAMGAFSLVKQQYFSLFEKCFRWILNSIYINVWAIFIGFVFDIEFFKSYPYTPRFGYNGFILVTTITMVSLGIYYHQYVTKQQYAFRLLVTLIATLLIGKKMMILYVALIVIHYLYISYRKFFYMVALLGSLLGGYILYDFQNIITYFPFWKDIYDEKGLLSTLTSLRTDLLAEALVFVKQYWSVFTLFSGSLFFPVLSTEFGIVDIFFFFGLTGVVVFFLFIKKILLLKQQPAYNYIIIILLVADALSGTVLNTVSAMLLIALWNLVQRIGSEKEIVRRSVN